jgi:phage terminase large subunit-like protein
VFETGKVLLKAEAAWLPAYKQELLGFPNARHDDQVDSTFQALNIIQNRIRPCSGPKSMPNGTSGRLERQCG